MIKKALTLSGDMLACGLENGAIWILHHITLEPLDNTPYKHSSAAINKIIFTQCADYMAYAVSLIAICIKIPNYFINIQLYKVRRTLYNHRDYTGSAGPCTRLYMSFHLALCMYVYYVYV